MIPRRFKLILLSHDLTRKVELTLSHRKVRAALLGLAVCFLATNIVAGLLASFLINSRENEALKTENERLRLRLSAMDMRLAGISQQVTMLNETDRLLRLLADLPQVDEDVKNVGVGGGSGDLPLDDLSPQLSYSLWTMDKLSRELELQRASFEEIHSKLTSNAQLVDHTPTLRPIEGGYISSSFGLRRDPFTKGVEFHAGVDICNERGTPVMATAEGSVIYAGHYYSYGKFVVIDHGFGYQTAYGHLSSIDVRQGQYVQKGQLIGKVGSTGRATAPHLHYEVRVNGRTVDPTQYFFEDVAALPAARSHQ